MKLQVFVFLLCTFGVADGFLGWLFNPHNDEKTSLESDPQLDGASSPSASGVIRRVPFEVKSVDDKFLSSGRELMMAGLSELDSCHHRVCRHL